MTTAFTVGYLVGSISEVSINRRLARALEALAPGVDLELVEIPLKDLPFYNHDFEADGAQHPSEATAFREAIRGVDAVLIVTPEYNRSIPGVLKNALDWVSRPKTAAPLGGKPVYVVGASTGAIGTALAQQHLRSVLSFLACPQLHQPEVYLQLTSGLIEEDGKITKETTRDFLTGALTAFRDHIALHVPAGGEDARR